MVRADVSHHMTDCSRTTSFLAFEEKEGRLFTQSSIMQTLMLPSREVQWGIDNFAVRLSIDSCRTVWASSSTQAVADAFFDVNDRYSVFFGDCVYLAPFPTCSASYAFIRVNDRVVVGVGNRIVYAPFIDSSKYPATTTTTVADITYPFHHVTDCMNQTQFLDFIKKCERFLF